MSATIRQVRAGDRDAIYDICLRTSDAGGDGRHLYADPELPGHVWAGAYVALEPEHGFVVVDAEDRAIGYILGALDSVRFEERLEAQWWPSLRRRYRTGTGTGTGTGAGLPGERIARYLINHPARADAAVVADYPSHLHIDLLPEAQGHGDGRRLVDRLLASLRDGGSIGVHLGVATRNVEAVGFYRALGFEELSHDDRHHVFGMRLGR